MDKDKILKFWYWTGRVLPLVALASIMIFLAFDLQTPLQFLLCAIAVIFAMFAFAWWWWVLDTVKSVYAMLNTAQEKFNEVITELKDIKKEINDSDRKRVKQGQNKPK